MQRWGVIDEKESARILRIITTRLIYLMNPAAYPLK